MTPDAPSRPPSPSPPHCALLVEDDDLVRELYASMLARLGHEVLAAAAADHALRLYDARADDIGWVMLDVLLPDRSGHELLAELRRRRPGLPALVVSGRTEFGRSEEATRTVFLSKPFEMGELRRAIERTLRGGVTRDTDGD